MKNETELPRYDKIINLANGLSDRTAKQKFVALADKLEEASYLRLNRRE